jgi:hypothetical protein
MQPLTSWPCFVAPQPGIAHQQDRRARGTPLPSFCIVLIPKRPDAALIQRLSRLGPQLGRQRPLDLYCDFARDGHRVVHRAPWDCPPDSGPR